MNHKVLRKPGSTTYKCYFCIEVSIQNAHIVPDRIVLLLSDKRGAVAHLFMPVDTFVSYTFVSHDTLGKYKCVVIRVPYAPNIHDLDWIQLATHSVGTLAWCRLCNLHDSLGPHKLRSAAALIDTR